MGFSDRMLNMAFRFAKIVSVGIAALLVLVFFAALGYAVIQWRDQTSQHDVPDFEASFNESLRSNSAPERDSEASSRSDIETRNRINNRYGDSIGDAMTDAGCSADQFDFGMRQLVLIASKPDIGSHVDDVADGAIRWFEGAAEMKASGASYSLEWACGRTYWEGAAQSIIAREASQQAALQRLLTGLGIALATLLAAFLLMVIPAIYRIEENIRRA